MDLPGAQDELDPRVSLAANPSTVVVVNAGVAGRRWTGPTASPRSLQVWFGGQEMAHAIVDVLTGDAEPAGRLPTTFPVRLEHNPSFGNFPGENGEVRYGEGSARRLPLVRRAPAPDAVPVRARPVVHDVRRSARPTVVDRAPSGDALTVDVPVTNTGTRRGAEVVQCYVAPPPRRGSPARSRS